MPMPRFQVIFSMLSTETVNSNRLRARYTDDTIVGALMSYLGRGARLA